jgi:hypothetical protein
LMHEQIVAVDALLGLYFRFLNEDGRNQPAFC